MYRERGRDFVSCSFKEEKCERMNVAVASILANLFPCCCCLFETDFLLVYTFFRFRFQFPIQCFGKLRRKFRTQTLVQDTHPFYLILFDLFYFHFLLIQLNNLLSHFRGRGEGWGRGWGGRRRRRGNGGSCGREKEQKKVVFIPLCEMLLALTINPSCIVCIANTIENNRIKQFRLILSKMMVCTIFPSKNIDE